MTERTEERVPRPEEVIEVQEVPSDELKPKALRCQYAAGTGNPCPREATTWLYPEERQMPACDEHARLYELSHELNDWDATVDVIADWLRLTEAWGIYHLERLAMNAYQEAKQERLKIDAKVAACSHDSRRSEKGAHNHG